MNMITWGDSHRIISAEKEWKCIEVLVWQFESNLAAASTLEHNFFGGAAGSHCAFQIIKIIFYHLTAVFSHCLFMHPLFSFLSQMSFKLQSNFMKKSSENICAEVPAEPKWLNKDSEHLCLMHCSAFMQLVERQHLWYWHLRWLCRAITVSVQGEFEEALSWITNRD